MRIAWTILLISALTDFVVAGGTGLTAAMVATKEVQMPSSAVWLLSGIGGLIAAARTVQQALKAAESPQTVENLRRNPE